LKIVPRPLFTIQVKFATFGEIVKTPFVGETGEPSKVTAVPVSDFVILYVWVPKPEFADEVPLIVSTPK
jgi:hypothetical protein